MTEYYFMNGEYTEAGKAVIPVRTHAFMYGTSVFEGIRAYWNDEDKQLYAFRAPEHYERIQKSARIMHMESPYTTEEYCEITKKLLKKNNYKEDAYLRPTLYKKTQRVGPGLQDNEDGFLIIANKMGHYIDVPEGLKVCVSSWRRNSDNAIPPRAKVAGGYANAALIKADAHYAGYDDAIVLDEQGYVTEGSAMNLFLIQDGKLITTTKTDNILVGVTRNTVIEIARDILGIETEERQVSRTELYISDEAFYCGTGAQILPVTSIDNRKTGSGKIGEITKELQKIYFDVVRGKVPKYKKWCLGV
ncbi:MAG: branched-chain amino acid transaminase [Heliobacteriaceae bacterium]|jgi:branched-chain amino acid aminotransferase|nr:branched-chain amino acid transaminase [Heliobacteriaceae bacterium]